MYTPFRCNKTLISAGLLLTVSAIPVQATTVLDAYVGGNDHGRGDVIGAAADFNTLGMDISVSGSMLTVSINTNFAGKGDDMLFAGINGMPNLTNGLGIGYGDLFLSSSWNPAGTAPYVGDNASNGTVWTYGFALDNRWMNEGSTGTGTLYSLNSGDNTLDARMSDSFMSGGIFRNGQEVAVNTRSNGVSPVANNLSSWYINAADKTVNFNIDLSNTGLIGSDIAVHWGMTCANDVIEGVVPAVPVPAAVWLFGSGLMGLLAVARRKVA
ncbi:MAG: hypothetical protein WBN96_00865 [Gammaproteobacteria bacterium]